MQTAQTASAVATSPGRARRRLVPVIDARFQWKYTLLITALGVGVTAIMGGFLYRSHVTNTRVLELSEALRQEVARNDQIFLLYLVVLVVVMALVLAIWGIIVTHRISGPLYIVARYLSVIAAGQYPDVRPLRKRDELHEFFAAFEEAVNAMRNRDIAAVRELDEALADARKNSDKQAAIDALAVAVQRHRDALSRSIGRGEGAAVE